MQEAAEFGALARTAEHPLPLNTTRLPCMPFSARPWILGNGGQRASADMHHERMAEVGTAAKNTPGIRQYGKTDGHRK